MYHYFEALTNTSGDSLVGYFARVVDRATQAAITLYSDEAGTPISTVSGYPNLAKTDDYGNLDFYLAPGTYHLDIYAPDAVTFRFRVNNVGMTSVQGQQGDKGDTGDPGPAMATYTTLAAFKAADIANKSQFLQDPAITFGPFYWETANAPYTADNINVIKADSTALSVGAWVRQKADGISVLQAGTGAVARTVQAKLRDSVSVKDFGATGDGVTDDTAAIQAAINTGARDVIFPSGAYKHGALTLGNQYQRLIGYGALLGRNSAAVTISVTARGVSISGIRFTGSGLGGDNLTITAPDVTLTNCESRDCLGYALNAANFGGNLYLNGGVYKTDTAASYDIRLFDNSTGSLYTHIHAVVTNQGVGSTGGLMIDGAGTVFVSSCEFGKLTTQNGGGGMFIGSRFVGAVSIQSAAAQFAGCAFASSVTFGDGAGPNIGQIGFDNACMVSAAGSLTINSEVIQSSFFLGQVYAGGAAVTVNATAAVNNDIWHGRISYAATFQSQNGDFAVGNGSVVAGYSRAGRDINFDWRVAWGSTTTNGTGAFYIINTPYVIAQNSYGGAEFNDASATPLCLQSQALATNNVIYARTTATSALFSPTAPVAPANGDVYNGSVSFRI